MVTVINKDNSKWRLLYNDHLLLLDKSNSLTFDIADEKLAFTAQIEFIFSDSGEKLKANINVSEDGSKVIITLYQWDTHNSLAHVEVIEPVKLNTVNGQRIWLKYRTQTNERNFQRNFHLSLWGEEVES